MGRRFFRLSRRDWFWVDYCVLRKQQGDPHQQSPSLYHYYIQIFCHYWANQPNQSQETESLQTDAEDCTLTEVQAAVLLPISASNV